MRFDDIVKVLQEHKGEIMGFGVEKIGIFGSYVKGCHSENSDIDILVSFGEVPKIAKAYFGLKFYLEDLLKMEVVLCREKDIRIELKNEIMKSVKYILDEKWQILLRKAQADLNAATILCRENTMSKEVIMFHLEQAVEKLIKAVLEKNNVDYAEIDNLFELMKLSQERIDFDNEQLNLLGELNEYRFEEYSENLDVNDVNNIDKYFNFVNEVERKVLEIL